MAELVLGLGVSPDDMPCLDERRRAALAAARDELARADPDVVVVIGHDQDELFSREIRPAFAVSHSAKVSSAGYPGAAELGRHILVSLIDQNFDPASVLIESDLRLSNAHEFVQRHVLQDKSWPIVPVFVNCLFEPTQPTARRCLEFGLALRWAIRSWHTDTTVALIASGGLSHPVSSDDPDRRLLDALTNRDLRALSEIPEGHLKSESSQLRSWMVAGAAAMDLAFTEIDYIPASQTSEGRSCGTAFGAWR